MNLFEQRPLLVLVDVESGIVLGTVPTVACGQALMLGLLNTQINFFPIQVMHRKDDWDSFNFNGTDTLYTINKGWQVTAVDKEQVTPRIVERRRLMWLRLSYLHPWEMYCKGSLTRFRGYMSDGVQAFVRHELASGEASSYIREYASIHGIDVGNAIEELGSKVRSLGMIEARNWAQFEKVAQQMTRCNTREELAEAMRHGFDILYNNAYI